MRQPGNSYAELVNFARDGDRSAELELNDRLGQAMIFVVWRVLQPGGAVSPKDQAIYDKARQMGLTNPDTSPEECDHRIRFLARQLCDETLDRVLPRRSAWNPDDTLCTNDDASLQIAR